MRPREAAKDEAVEPQANGIYRCEFTVPETAIDGNGHGHVNNVVYVQWMQDIAIAHFTATGGADLMHTLGGTWVVNLRRVRSWGQILILRILLSAVPSNCARTVCSFSLRLWCARISLADLVDWEVSTM